VTAALVLTGAPGAGKTTVLSALSDRLAQEDVAHAALEFEQLLWGHPWLTTADGLGSLAVLAGLERERGRRVMLLAATTETAGELRAVRAALAADRSVAVALRASPDTLAARVLAREPEYWSGREALAAHARELAAVIPGLDGVDAILETEGRRAEDVAVELHAVLARHALLGARVRGPTGPQ
jgi:GTPase SAR1 family protein